MEREADFRGNHRYSLELVDDLPPKIVIFFKAFCIPYSELRHSTTGGVSLFHPHFGHLLVPKHVFVQKKGRLREALRGMTSTQVRRRNTKNDTLAGFSPKHLAGAHHFWATLWFFNHRMSVLYHESDDLLWNMCQMLRNKHIKPLKKLLRAVDGRVGRQVRSQKWHSHVISFSVLNAAGPLLKKGAADCNPQAESRQPKH